MFGMIARNVIAGQGRYYPEQQDEAPQAQSAGYYVSWDFKSGSTGKWHDRIEDAEATYAAHRKNNSSRWYKLPDA